jgi:glc operon protein GlcG
MSELVDARSVSLISAQRVIAAAVTEADRMGVRVCVAVVDNAAHLVAFARMDQAPLLCIQIAQDKAFSVASFGGLRTSEWWNLLESDPALRHGIVKTDRLIVFGGGVPLVVDGDVVGGIGVSGASSEQDAQVATAGAASLGGSSDVPTGGDHS